MLKTLRLFFVGVLLSAGYFVEAQQELPIVDGYVRGYATEVLFPMAVRFRVTFSQSVEFLSELTLRIESAGQAPIEVMLDLEADMLSGDDLFTEYDFVWEFPADIRLPLFGQGNVIYKWQAVDSVGRTARVRDTLTFRDDRVNWVVDEDPDAKINLYVSADGPDPQQIRQGVQLAYDLITTNVGRAEPVNVIIYGPSIDLSVCELALDEETGEEQLVSRSQVDGLTVPCDPDRAARIFANSDFSVLQSPGANLSSAQSVLVEWLVEHFYGPRWRAGVPAWFRLGLAEFYQPLPKTRLLQPVQTAARTNRLLSFGDMGEERGDELWRAQSFAMVAYIADLVGVQGLFDLANSTDFAAAYEQASNQALAALLPNLRRWIFTDRAIGAFDYTPYQPETATPTPSRTLTPFPPTATNTPTATATLTVTPSVTGELSPTPTLSATPSRTSTRPPPSVTPRSVSAFFTPTLTPVSTVLDNPVSRLGIIATLLIILAILGLVYVLLGRRDD